MDVSYLYIHGFPGLCDSLYTQPMLVVDEFESLTDLLLDDNSILEWPRQVLIELHHYPTNVPCLLAKFAPWLPHSAWVDTDTPD
jgi:hypothetical protein